MKYIVPKSDKKFLVWFETNQNGRNASDIEVDPYESFEAAEFLLDKIKGTKNNEEFLISMFNIFIIHLIGIQKSSTDSGSKGP